MSHLCVPDPPAPRDPPPGIGERGSEMSDEDRDAAEVDRKIDAARDKGKDAEYRADLADVKGE